MHWKTLGVGSKLRAILQPALGWRVQGASLGPFPRRGEGRFLDRGPYSETRLLKPHMHYVLLGSLLHLMLQAVLVLDAGRIAATSHLKSMPVY